MQAAASRPPASGRHRPHGQIERESAPCGCGRHRPARRASDRRRDHRAESTTAHSSSPPTTAASSTWSSGRPAPRSTGTRRIASRAADRRPAAATSSTAATPSASSTSATARAFRRNSTGSSSRRCRGAKGPAPRCLLSVVDRTVEAPGGAHPSRRDAARQPDRPAEPARLQRSDREGRAKMSRATSTMPCSSSTCCASAGSTNRWAALPATSC